MKEDRIEYFDSSDYQEEQSPVEYFSLMQDLKLAKYPLNQKFRLLLLDYSKYVQTKKSTLDKATIDEIDKLLISKFNLLVNESEDNLKGGQTLDISLRINDQELKKRAIKFSREYKKLLLARSNLGYIPKEVQIRVDDAYKLMIGELRKLVFKPVLNLFSLDPNDLPQDPDKDVEVAKTLKTGKPTLAQLREMVIGAFKKENVEANVEIIDDKIVIIHETDQN